ncbi:YfhO family protein [Cellulosilyticum ruminicola]|uniref:YfhO family protein n=1 Tax=Cellulosilyticum ruminicola TaxID=425254 RepID=UPI0006D04307|nr:YfhO family protein [Cellulosilyticum ruminicola]
MRDIYLGKGSLLYSFNKGLGGNMSGLFAYYLASPLNLILLGFSKAHITEAILLISLCKIGLCGLTAARYLNVHFKRKDMSVIIFSTCYALMSYNICHLSNLMWLDGVIGLPIILLGLEKLIYKRQSRLYLISLALCIYSNYYIGYMLCIASVIYFIYAVCLQNLKFLPLKKIIRQFILASLGAGGLPAILLIPTLFSLKTGKMDFRLTESLPQVTFHLNDLISKFFISSFNFNQLQDGFPNLFIGSLLLSLALSYFFNKQIERKDKIITGILLIIFYISFNINYFNLIWHGFDYPYCFPYRNAFIVSFILLQLAYNSFDHLEGLELRHFGMLIGFWFGISRWMSLLHYDFLGKRQIGLTLTCMLLGLLLLYMYKLKAKRYLLLCIAAVVYGELLINATMIEKSFDYLERKLVVNSIKDFESSITELSKTGDFSRVEDFYQISDNDPMLYGYYGINHSSSSIEQSSLKFLQNIGVCSNQNLVNQIYTEGGTLPTDMLFSIKYYLKWHSYKPIDYLNQTWGAQKLYNCITPNETMEVYENPYALPIGYAVSQKAFMPLVGVDNAFEVQNSLLHQLANNVDDYYEPIMVQDIQYANLKVNRENDEVHYTKENPSLKGTITYTLKMPYDAPIYMQLTSKLFETQSIKRNPVAVYVNGVDASYYFLGREYGIKNVGAYKKGELIHITLELTDSEFYLKDSFFIA